MSEAIPHQGDSASGGGQPAGQASSAAIDVTYRRGLQKRLFNVITTALVKAAGRLGKIGGTVQRYGDSPERNGVPAKQFAIIADNPHKCVWQ